MRLKNIRRDAWWKRIKEMTCMINAPVSLLPDAEVRLYNVQDTVKETEYCGRRIGGSKRL